MPRKSSYGSLAMEFRILGPLEVSAGEGAIKMGGPKQRAVLVHLILRANRLVPIDLLIDGIWGEEPPETAKNTLQTYVYRLRQMLGEDRIVSERGGYVLHARAEEIDAARFETMIQAAKADLASDPSKAAAALSDALGLWRGAPLSDLSDEPSLRGEIARRNRDRSADRGRSIRSGRLRMARRSDADHLCPGLRAFARAVDFVTVEWR